MGLGDAEIRHEKGDGLRGHDPPAVGVDGELAGGNLLLANGLLDELLGQFRALPRRDHPADDMAAEDIEDDIEIEVGPLGRTQQFGDVPTPELVGSSGQQFGLVVSRMHRLIAALVGFPGLFEEAIHRASRTEILAFVQQGGLHGGRRTILETLVM